MIDGIRTGGKGIRAPKFIQVGESGLADVSFMKFCILDVDVIGNTNFHGKTDRSKNRPTCEKAVARTHGSWMLWVMGSCSDSKPTEQCFPGTVHFYQVDDKILFLGGSGTLRSIRTMGLTGKKKTSSDRADPQLQSLHLQHLD